MSREFFKKTTNQELETKAFLISGGTGIERLRKANELIGQFFNQGHEVIFERCLYAAMMSDDLKKGENISEADEVKIENPVIFMIDPISFDDDGFQRCRVDSIERLAILQGNVIELTPTPSLQPGK
ncbi:MAG: hypothetical protein ACD_42C00549G0001 [uncultured bacterium]|nr:MAG: hypothetical protein ACD_42C00549G0001 [uncultured bacterium]